MRPLYLAAFLCAAMGFAVACGDDDDDDATTDSGTRGDAGTGDSGTRDGGIDAGTDAGRPDSGTLLDAGLRPDSAVTDASTLATSMGAWTVFTNPYGDGGANSASNVAGSAVASRTSTGMHLTLTVTGLAPSRTYGTHLHKLACDNSMAGGHYQHNASPADASTDPTFANMTNEVWLDFTTDATGKGNASADVTFVPRLGEAKAIVIHDRMTGTGGVAGPKLACINITF